MNKQMLISIIVPIYNAEKFLERCVDSIINQTYKNLEILLIDDGSTDNSGKICEKYKKKDERISVVHKENGGVSNTRNIGLNLANGEYVFFIDADDFLDDNVISELVKNSYGFDIIKTSYKINNKNKIKSIKESNIYDKNEYINKVILGNIGGHCWGYLIRRDIIQNIVFDENTSCMEDTIFIISCILKVEKIKVIDSSFYNHIINENSITCSKNKIVKNMNDYMYSLKEIKSKVNKQDINILIEQKKIILIEKELSKVSSKKELKNMINEFEVDIDTKNVNIYYKIFMFCVENKMYLSLFSLIKLRNILKYIKNNI